MLQATYLNDLMGLIGQKAGGKIGHLSFAPSSALKLGSCSHVSFCSHFSTGGRRTNLRDISECRCYMDTLQPQGTVQMQGWVWGFLSCRGDVCAVCTFPAHKTSRLDPVVNPHPLQNTPPHIDIKTSTVQCVYKWSPVP